MLSTNKSGLSFKSPPKIFRLWSNDGRADFVRNSLFLFIITPCWWAYWALITVRTDPKDFHEERAKTQRRVVPDFSPNLRRNSRCSPRTSRASRSSRHQRYFVYDRMTGEQTLCVTVRFFSWSHHVTISFTTPIISRHLDSDRQLLLKRDVPCTTNELFTTTDELSSGFVEQLSLMFDKVNYIVTVHFGKFPGKDHLGYQRDLLYCSRIQPLLDLHRRRNQKNHTKCYHSVVLAWHRHSSYLRKSNRC